MQVGCLSIMVGEVLERVAAKGGLEAVQREKRWAEIAREMGIDPRKHSKIAGDLRTIAMDHGPSTHDETDPATCKAETAQRQSCGSPAVRKGAACGAQSVGKVGKGLSPSARGERRSGSETHRGAADTAIEADLANDGGGVRAVDIEVGEEVELTIGKHKGNGEMWVRGTVVNVDGVQGVFDVEYAAEEATASSGGNGGGGKGRRRVGETGKKRMLIKDVDTTWRRLPEGFDAASGERSGHIDNSAADDKVQIYDTVSERACSCPSHFLFPSSSLTHPDMLVLLPAPFHPSPFCHSLFESIGKERSTYWSLNLLSNSTRKGQGVLDQRGRPCSSVTAFTCC